MKYYISGAISNVDNYQSFFNIAENFLKREGHSVVNPCRISEEVQSRIENPTYEDYMRADILALLKCDAIYMLKGWKNSYGAKIEHAVAEACGLVITYEV